MFMAHAAIFLQAMEKTKNSNTEKRFSYFTFNLVTKKTFYSSLMIFVFKINSLF